MVFLHSVENSCLSQESTMRRACLKEVFGRNAMLFLVKSIKKLSIETMVKYFLKPTQLFNLYPDF